jgi:hypothetical protein
MLISRRWLGRAVAAAALVVGTAGAAEAQAVAWSGPGDFDDVAISFAPITVNQLQSITGGGYIHNHGTAATVFSFDVHYAGGSWQTIFSTMINTSDHLLSDFVPPPVNFALGSIDGLRLVASPTVGNGYHGMYGSSYASGTTTFNFGVAATTAPEPGTLALAASGAALLVGIARRRRRAAVA